MPTRPAPRIALLLLAIGIVACRRDGPPAAPIDSVQSGKNFFSETFRGGSPVWTGTEIIIWNGTAESAISGWRFNPATNSRKPVSATNSPSLRVGARTVWTGHEMIIWGGMALPMEERPDGSKKLNYLVTGARYNPETDIWTTMSTIDAPSGAGQNFGVVWTGSEMLLWGGDGAKNSGARYDPATDRWVAMSTNGGPDSGFVKFAVWTGAEMIVWVRYENTNKASSAARYDPKNDSWKALNLSGAPVSGYRNEAGVWTGQELIVWAGRDAEIRGARYAPASDAWKPMSMVGAPDQRAGFQVVWTGEEMLVWGGSFGRGDYSHAGAKYNPVTDSWRAISTVGMSHGRDGYALVWTGSDVFIWGGSWSFDAGFRPAESIGRYNLATDAWTILTPTQSASRPPW